MALDANLLFRGLQAGLAPVAPVTNLLQGAQSGQQLMRGNIQNQMLEQQLQQQQALAPLQQRALEQNLAQAEAINPLQQQLMAQNVQQGEQAAMDAEDQRVAKSIVFAAQDALLLPSEKRGEFLQERLRKLKERGADFSDTQEAISMYNEMPPDQFEGVLKNIVSAGVSRGVINAGNTPSQFGGQETFKDEKGNLFFGTTKRDPKTGEVKSVLAPIDGKSEPFGKISMAGTYGLTAEEKVNQVGLEKTEADRAQANEAARQDYIKQGLSARSMIPKTQKLIELNEAITSGKLSKASKFMQDIFGVTDPDLGQFNALAGSLVLDNIKSLGANPTEGERAFLMQITPSLEQGGKVNEALLKDMLEIQKRQVDRAKWFSKNRNKTVEEYLLETEKEDFTPSISPEDIAQDSAPKNRIRFDAQGNMIQ